MKRGDLVTIAISGDYGKPRPALVIQADAFVGLPSVTILRLTSDLGPERLLRFTVEPNSINGLRVASQIMIDKAATVPREKIGQVFGMLDDMQMQNISRSLAAFLGLDILALATTPQII
jgi:mRNA interferase MazF